MSSISHADPIALNFNETCLRMSDVQLLRGPHWLNDQIISFYYEYLESTKYKNNKDLLFVSPEVTQCIKLTDDGELRTLLHQMGARQKPFIFFVINVNENTSTFGSPTHWSLIILSKPERAFFHFDSCGNKISLTSQQFMQRIKGVLNCRNYLMKPLRCSQQQINNYDCGIYVLCMTDNIADNVNRYECVEGVGPLHQDIISAKRSNMLKLIQSLGGKM